jgi:hypothetical protein
MQATSLREANEKLGEYWIMVSGLVWEADPFQ